MTYSEALSCYLLVKLRNSGHDIHPDTRNFFLGPIKIKPYDFKTMMAIGKAVAVCEAIKESVDSISGMLDQIFKHTELLKDCNYYENCNGTQPDS